MLRITADHDGDRSCLRLEGRLVGPWIAELAAVVEQHDPGLLVLDLARLQFVDAAGLDLLTDLQQRGVVLLSASPFITHLLQAHGR
jgi:hypothetical protein